MKTKLHITITFFILVAICNRAKTQVCFTSANYPVGYGTTTIACSDFNNDGNLDLAIAMYAQNIYMLPGNGLGGFGPAVLIAPDSLVYNLRSFINGDFNKDGNADLAITTYSQGGPVRILFGDGTGNFPTKNNFTVGDHPFNACTADFNNDGNPDIATANSGSANISILLGNGSGGFSQSVNFPAGSDPVAITSGDFNGDGNDDLTVANNYGGGWDSVWVLLGDGTGNFGTSAKYFAGGGPYSVCSKDFNADGFDDIAVANSNSNNVSVLLSKGSSGTFFPAFNYTAGNGSGSSAPFSVVSEDFNSDGKPDLAVANFYQSIVCTILNIGSGSFGPTTFYSAPSGPWTVISADFNSDGKPDLATANHDKPEVTVLLNCTTTGIEDSYEENYCSAFPNPTNSSFTVSVPPAARQIRIFNSLGQEIENKFIDNQAKYAFELENSGIYFIQIATEEGLTTKKMVVQQ